MVVLKILHSVSCARLKIDRLKIADDAERIDDDSSCASSVTSQWVLLLYLTITVLIKYAVGAVSKNIYAIFTTRRNLRRALFFSFLSFFSTLRERYPKKISKRKDATVLKLV